MEKYTRKNLNIVRLLTLGDLDMRGVVEENELCEADDYFSKVEEFIQNAPQHIIRLNIVSKTTDTAETIPVLEKLSEVLTGIGYAKVSSTLESAIEAVTDGDYGSGSDLIAKISDGVSTLYERIKVTYTAKRFSGKGAENAGSEEDGEETPFLLSQALDYYDYLEMNRKLRVLAVDDITPVLNTVTSILRPYYEVYAIKNSSQVEGFLKHTMPELFLLDIEMNEVNGFDLIPIIRQFKAHKETPIIFLTGNASMNNLKDAISLGACDFITKPIDKAVLLEKIKRNIVRKRAY